VEQLLTLMRLTALANFLAFSVGGEAVSGQRELQVFTHGQGDFARLQVDGSFDGHGVDLLRCSMRGVGWPYSLSQAVMARKERLAQQGTMDIWFPSIVYGNETRLARLAFPIGEMAIHWYVRNGADLDPKSVAFKKAAKVSAFPGSAPSRILLAEGFNVQPGTDDENTIVLWLMEGRLDAFLSANFETILKPRARELLESQVRRTLYKKFDVGFEFTSHFAQRYPGFAARFQKALNACRQ